MLSVGMSVRRFDAGQLGKAERTPSGGIRIPGFIGRTGIQVYTAPDGAKRREYRPPEEVFQADSLATLGGAAVTRGHPAQLVNAKNWKQVAIGQVSDQTPERVKRDTAEFIEAKIAINDAVAINDVGSELVEISAGYTCDLELSPGLTPEGVHFDAVQRNIRYNHVALGPENWARAGREARLTLDGDVEVTETPRKSAPMKIRFDGVEYDTASEADMTALQKNIDRKVKADSDAADKLKAEEKAHGATQAKLDSVSAELKTSREVKIDELVADELEFRGKVSPVLGAEYDFTGKTRKAVQLDAIKALGGDMPEDASDDRIAGYLEARLADSDATDYNVPTGDGGKAPVKRDGGIKPKFNRGGFVKPGHEGK